MAQAITETHYAKTVENQFLEITFRSGRHDFLYRGDLGSGAIIAAIVERAKSLAIKQLSIQTKQETQLKHGMTWRRLCRRILRKTISFRYRRTSRKIGKSG